VNLYLSFAGSVGTDYIKLDFGFRAMRVDVFGSGTLALRGKYDVDDVDSDYEDEIIIPAGFMVYLPLCAESILLRGVDGAANYTVVAWKLLTKEGE